ncbi:MAG TPA: HlyD family secretion protein [Steroidobacteraceae bacterium]|nr:HlyD family secretion protein [Steroidobacteraceae bacterium]
MADAPPNGTDAPSAPQKPGPNRRVRIGLSVFAALLGILALVYGVRWVVHGRFVESTDDAYLRADSVTVAPRVSGYIDQLYVADNQKVTAGQPLLRIDVRNYRATLLQQTATVDARAADITAAQNQIAQAQAQVAQYRAQLDGARANAAYAAQEARRYQGLHAQGVETAEHLAQAVNERNQTAAAVAGAIAALRTAERQVTTLRSQVQQARAQLEAARAAAHTAQINVDDTLIRASIDGRVGDDTARLGQYVQPGTRLMTIVPVQAMYLVANFKETQIRRMRVGQPASVSVDALGGRELEGRVESFAPGTGAEFALLPPENATGNFTKIVQRVPVRIRLIVPKDLADRLVSGLSVTAAVDTSVQPSPAVPAGSPAVPAQPPAEPAQVGQSR